MTRANPLLVETLGGLTGAGRAQRDWLVYLLLQAMMVFLWWPKDSLPEVLDATDPPDTLLAAMLVAGATVSWYCLRAGAEELLLPGQHGLREWAAATRLGLARILAGYLGAHLLQVLHLLTLSLPLMMLAFGVSGGEWAAFGWCLCAIVFQATFYRLAAAAVYMAIGHHGAMTVLSVRALLLATYGLTTLLVPPLSHPALCWRLLKTTAGGVAEAEPLVFLLAYGVASALLAAVLHRQLALLREGAGEAVRA